MTDSPTIHLSSPRGWLLTLAVAGFAFLAATLVPVQTTTAQGAPAVDIQAATDGISVDFFATTPRNVLTFSVRVVGPDGFVFEQRIEGSTLNWIPPDTLADGYYNWEAWVVTADVGAQMRDPSPALKGRPADHWFHEAVKQTHIASGSFKVENGLLEVTARSRGNTESFPRTRRIASAILDFLVPSAQADDVGGDRASQFLSIDDDAETNNTRITLFNDSSFDNGIVLQNLGGDFRLGTGFGPVPNENLVTVTHAGNVGINTTSPTNRMQILHNDEDGLRFTNAGFGETFVIGAGASLTDCCGLYLDSPSGTQMFIDMGAPAHSFVVRDTANIGMGTSAPAAALHIQRANNTAEVRVQDTGSSDGQTMFNLINNGHPKFRYEDTSQTNVVWEFRTAGTQGGNESFNINKVGSGAAEMRVFAGGNVTIAGILTQSSSRTVKEGIVDLDPEEVLARLEELSVHEWSYQNNPGERHLGPMAEDFHAAYGLGRSTKHIAPGDLAGVALAAAKGLADRNKTLEDRSASLENETSALRAENAELRDRLERIEVMLLQEM